MKGTVDMIRRDSNMAESTKRLVFLWVHMHMGIVLSC